MKGQTLSHYRVLEMVGQGGSGVIYKAEDLSLGRPVALKCLPSGVPGSGSAVLRFQHEARTASGINHPNICTIHEIGEHNGQQFIVMEWLEGRTLAELIDGRPLKLENLLEYAIQVADGLQAAHAEGILHRDVKPANILVTDKGQVKILDFGIATLMGPSIDSSQPGLLRVGTAPYMSPEQVTGDDLDHRSDLFSLGIVLYEMATARRPFVAGTIADITCLITEHTPEPARVLNPQVPEELDRIITKALEKNRKLRFQSAADLKVDLQRLKRDFDSGVLRTAPRAATVPAPRPAHVVARVPRTPAVLAIASVIVLLAFVAHRRSVSDEDFNNVAHRQADVSVARNTDIRLDATATVGSTATPPQSVQSGPRGRKPSAAPQLRPPAAEPLTVAAKVSTDREDLNRELDIVRNKAEAGLNEQALQTLRPLLTRYASEPEIATAYFLMGDIQEAQGAHQDAMATYLEMADRFRDEQHSAQALYRFATVALKSKHIDRELKARDALRQLAARFPESEWAPQGLLLKAEIEERKRLHELDPVLGTSVPSALLTYRRLTEAYPTVSGSVLAHKKLAELYEAAKRYDLAARVFVDLATRFPDPSAEAWYRAAELYRRRLNDPKTARAAYANVPQGSRYFNDAQSRLRSE